MCVWIALSKYFATEIYTQIIIKKKTKNSHLLNWTNEEKSGTGN